MTPGEIGYSVNEANYDNAISIQPTSDGGYILAGETESYGAGKRDIWLIKTDANGNRLWDKTFGGPENDGGGYVHQTSDGGYIIAGFTESYGAGGYDAWLVKTNANGDRQWSKTFGGIGYDSIGSVQLTSDGGYILTGGTNSYGNGKRDVWIIKVDANGGMLWNRTFGGTGEDIGWSVQQTSDGGYIFAGETELRAGDSDAWLIKTDANGNMLWSKTFGGTSSDWLVSVQQTSDSGYILAGETESHGAGRSDAWLIKTEESGKKLWEKTFGESGHDEARSVYQTSDGGYIFAGETESYGAGGYDAWLIKIDSNGDQKWSKTLGGTGDDSADEIQQTSDGSYILVGGTASYKPYDHDFWLIKTDVNGNQQWSKIFGKT